MSSQVISHQQWSSESSQDASPPASLKSDASGSPHGKREKAKQVIDNLLNKFSRPRRDSTASRKSVERRLSKSRPHSLVAISSERPAPIPITVTSNMDTLSSSPSKRGKIFRRFSISSATDSVRSHESERSSSSLMQRVQDAARPDGYDTSEEVESSNVQHPPALGASVPTTDMAIQTEPAGLGESLVIIPSPIQEEPPQEPTQDLTAEEASVASLSPSLPPVLTPDEDVDRLSLEGASEGPHTPPAVSPEPQFVVPAVDESSHPESAIACGEPVISAITVEASSKTEISIGTTEAKAPHVSRAAAQPEADSDSSSPSFSQYLLNLVAPENLEQYRRPLGYTLTTLCYGLTWYLVTQAPGQALI